jgi:signal transduction histidine kinase
LPWVTGGSWRSSAYSGEFGEPSRNTVDYADQEIHLRAYTRFNLSPALAWHFHLLGQMLSGFYLGKLREQKLQQQSYLHAVYETGARLTHDVKNLLQSLNVLCTAAEQEEHGSDELQALMRRQLPVITSRLQQTLDKLRTPASETSGMVPAQGWWHALQRSQYDGQNIEFREGAISNQALLPRDLFDSAADNLIQNAIGKRNVQGDFAISVSFSCGESIVLEVCDAGRAMAVETAHEVLRGPVPSETGLGIGLYQVARLAEASGFTLELAHNEDGKVCFVLSGTAKPAADPPAI